MRHLILSLAFCSAVFAGGAPAPVQNMSREASKPKVPKTAKHDVTVVVKPEESNFWTFAGAAVTGLGVAVAGYFGVRSMQRK
mgnify:CR=1 FL=1